LYRTGQQVSIRLAIGKRLGDVMRGEDLLAGKELLKRHPTRPMLNWMYQTYHCEW
jgi:hypothetical protein